MYLTGFKTEASSLFFLDLHASHLPKSSLNPTSSGTGFRDKKTVFSVTSKHSTPLEKQRGMHTRQPTSLEPVRPLGISAIKPNT